MLKIKYSLNNLNLWLLPIGIFCEFFIEFFIIIVIIFNLFRNNSNLRVTRNFYYGLFFIIIYIISLALFNDYPYGKFIQQIILILPFVFFYSIIFKDYRSKIITIFDNYLKISFLVAFLGLIQFLIFAITNVNIFSWLYGRETVLTFPHFIRVTSIMDEPGYLSYGLTPALVFYIFEGFKKNLKQSICILICFFLTFSTVSFLVIFLAILYKLWLNHKLILISGGIVALFIIPLLTFNQTENKNEGGISGIIMRIEDTYDGVKDMDPHAFEALNLSSYATLTNLWVALNAPNRIMGTGLGTHELNYENLYQSNYFMYGLNSKDGYSLLNRLYSEFGVVGIIILSIFLIRHFNSCNFVNIAAFFILLSFLIKGGHYVRYGLIFWFYMFYYSSQFKNIKLKIK